MGNVILQDEGHIYKNLLDPDFKYMSVTTVLHRYEHPFDEEYHSKRIADRDGVTQQSVLDGWHEINRIAIEYGTNVHEIMERHLLNKQKMYVPRDEFERTVITEFRTLPVLPDHRILKPEYVLTHPLMDKFGIAGCADIIEDVDDLKFNVWDFKTNRELTFDTPYNEWLKFPLNHISQNKYNLYALQISIYAYFYELETHKKVNTLGILYWDRGEIVDATTGTWRVIPLPYMKTDVKNIINHFHTTL